jgi:hypothetical protein
MKMTFAQAGYSYVKMLSKGTHVLRDNETKKLEVWFCNKNHASYGLIWRNTHLEFARSYTENL